MDRGVLGDPTSYLRARDLDLRRPGNEEEDELPEDYWYRTHLTCASCEEHICFDEEMIAIVIVQAQYVVQPDEETGRPRGSIEFYPVLDDDGDFAHEPVLLDFGCWEDTCEEFHELIADEPKLRSRSPATDICKCSFCHTGIGPFQEFGRVMLGELVVSERKKETTFKETEGGSPEPVCLDCLERINDQCIELWKS